MFLTELGTSEGLAKGPVRRGNIEGHHRATITGGDFEGEGLAIEIVVALPVLAPVSWQLHPPSSWTFDGHTVNITGTTDVCDEDQVEIGVAIDCKPYASPSPAGYPTVHKKQHHWKMVSYHFQPLSSSNKFQRLFTDQKRTFFFLILSFVKVRGSPFS